MTKSNSSYFNARNIGLILAVALVYFVSAKVGSMLVFKNTNEAPVWPPSGIALAAVLLLGRRVWSGIMLGSFLVNLLVFISRTSDIYTAVGVSVFISIGNTFEALLGFYLLKKSAGNVSSFEKVEHVFRFTSIVLIMCLVSSIIGSLAVSFAKIVPWDQYSTVWFVWWLGHVAGILVAAPLLLAWAVGSPLTWQWNKKTIEIIILYLLVFFISELVFGNWLPPHSMAIKSYFILPLLLWAAFHFELRVMITALAIASAVAIFGTANGYGPFISESLTESLLSLQVYLSIISICILVLRAAVNERKELEATLKNVNDQLLINIKQSTDELSDYQNRVNSIFKTLLKYTVMDFSVKLTISEKRDEIDAIAAGLNSLGEELQNAKLTQTKYANELEQLNLLLIDSEQQIQSIFDNAPDTVIVIDTESTVLKWNPQAEITFGWKATEVIGKPLHEFIIPARYRELHLKGMKRFLTSGKSTVLNNNFEIEALNKQGAEFPVALSISPVMMEGKYLFIGFVRNISEQKKAEKKIKELAAIVESSDDAIISKLPDGTILSWNKAAEKIYGYSAEEAIGKSISIITPPQQMDELVKIPEQLSRDQQIMNIDTERIKKDGSQISVSLTASAIRDSRGGVTAISLISRDITENKKMASDVLRISEELKRSNTELEQFAYVASHDLQEPLRMVTSYLQLLEKRYKDKLDQDANDFIGFAVDGSNRMRTLINSLLDYSRINRIKPFEWIDLNLLINDVLEILSSSIKENNAIIKVNTLPKIYGDHVLIEQLFQNLIGNALKFRKAEIPEILISAVTEEDDYLFSIKDNGIGIQKEYLNKIFVIFQRLHSKEKYPGTGIGLAICKKVVERHRGKIWVESEIDNGSTFYFTIKK